MSHQHYNPQASGPLGRAAGQGVLQVRNLDTGELVDVSELNTTRSSFRLAHTNSGLSNASSEHTHASDTHASAAQPKTSGKGWFKGAKHKMAKVAKRTFTAIVEDGKALAGQVEDSMHRAQERLEERRHAHPRTQTAEVLSGSQHARVFTSNTGSTDGQPQQQAFLQQGATVSTGGGVDVGHVQGCQPQWSATESVARLHPSWPNALQPNDNAALQEAPSDMYSEPQSGVLSQDWQADWSHGPQQSGLLSEGGLQLQQQRWEGSQGVLAEYPPDSPSTTVTGAAGTAETEPWGKPASLAPADLFPLPAFRHSPCDSDSSPGYSSPGGPQPSTSAAVVHWQHAHSSELAPKPSVLAMPVKLKSLFKSSKHPPAVTLQPPLLQNLALHQDALSQQPSEAGDSHAGTELSIASSGDVAGASEGPHKKKGIVAKSKQLFSKGMAALRKPEAGVQGPYHPDQADLSDTIPEEPLEPAASHLPKSPRHTVLGLPVKTKSARDWSTPGRLLSQVRLVQEIHAHEGAVWAAKWNQEGTLLATAGQDCVVRVWAVEAPCTGLAFDANPSGIDRMSHPLPLPPQFMPGNFHDTLTNTQAQARWQDPEATMGSQQRAATAGPLLSVDVNGTSTQLHQDGSDPSMYAHEPSPSGAGQSPLLQQDFGRGLGLLSSTHHLLRPQPVLLLTGHTDDVLDLAWSAGSFLAASSADGTAKVWHVPSSAAATCNSTEATDDAPEQPLQVPCLEELHHPDFVTGVAFHPTDPRLLATGCADGVVRVWSVGEGRVLASSTILQDMVTCVAWLPEGEHIVAGTLYGKCRHYEWVAPCGGSVPSAAARCSATAVAASKGPALCTGISTGLAGSQQQQQYRLDHIAQVDVKDRRGAPGSGRKVTALVPVPQQPGGLLVSAADSRVRLFKRYALAVKYKGARNTHSLVRCSAAADGKVVVCGSDDGRVVCWDTIVTDTVNRRLKSKNACYDSFRSNEAGPVTVAIVAPEQAWRVGRWAALQELAARQHVLQAAKQKLAGSPGLTVSSVGMLADVSSQDQAQPDWSTVHAATPHLLPVRASATQGLSALPGDRMLGVGDGVADEQGVSGMAARDAARVAGVAGHPAFNSALLGALFVVAGWSGRLLVYENL